MFRRRCRDAAAGQQGLDLLDAGLLSPRNAVSRLITRRTTRSARHCSIGPHPARRVRLDDVRQRSTRPNSARLSTGERCAVSGGSVTAKTPPGRATAHRISPSLLAVRTSGRRRDRRHPGARRPGGVLCGSRNHYRRIGQLEAAAALTRKSSTSDTSREATVHRTWRVRDRSGQPRGATPPLPEIYSTAAPERAGGAPSRGPHGLDGTRRPGSHAPWLASRIGDDRAIDLLAAAAQRAGATPMTAPAGWALRPRTGS